MQPQHYPTFRKRLLIRVGIIVGLALLLVVGVSWIGALNWLRIDATQFVQKEADEIASFVVRAGDILSVESYPWNEPHHMFDEARIDPLFVQILDRNKREIFATVNVDLFSEGAYPRGLVGVLPDDFSPFSSLKTQFVGPSELYFTAFPLRASDKSVLGYIQIARFLPHIQQTVRSLAFGALIGSAFMLFGLLVLIYVNAGRLLAPLHTIAKTADNLSAEQLDVRIPDLENADRESVSLALAFNRLISRLGGSFEEMKRFNSNASHQLQTPLTVLKGHIDVTLRKERTALEYRKTLQLASDETNAMVGIVRSLMQLSRLESNPSGIPKEPVCLSDVCAHVINLVDPEKSRVDAQVDPNIWILSQADLSGQLIGIFLDNAMKYDPDGVISLRLTSTAEEVILEIEDHGIGINAEELGLVRERFFRSQSVQDQRIAGEGLGLALADQIARWQGARWNIDSAVGKGSKVICHFPLLRS